MIPHLRAAGVSLVLDARGAAAPALVHWGADLGELDEASLAALADAVIPAVPPSSVDVPLRLSIVAGLGDGWSGRPMVSLSGMPGVAEQRETIVDDSAVETTSLIGDAVVTTRFELTAEGVLLVTHRIRNGGDSPVTLTAADVALPVPDRAREVVDFTGRWSAEREPQRLRPPHGVWLRETRHGRGGHDDPFLTMIGTPGFGFREGEVWAVHLAWSGDRRHWVERSALGRTLLAAGERFSAIDLAPGDEYAAPMVVAVWSGVGIDGISDRLHPWVRSWATPRPPRPLTLNTWEAVYFDQSPERLGPLVEQAAELGIERFVLDDGWFRGRTDDRRALGDWYVDAAKWPAGLGPLADRVTAAGMQFGLWVEPEMVSLDSDLARDHPDWLLTSAGSVTWRFQHVLDLTHPAAAEHVFARLDALLSEHPIAYLKWDHNRDLLVEHSRGQVLALYALLDRVRAAHPHVEIESCASGGARIDLEILRRVDRFWVSDSNDPLQRQRSQRWTGVVVPPEFLGSHVGDATAHTTGRTASPSFRLATALFLHAGVESDLTALSDDARASLRAWAHLYRRQRALLHHGTVVRADQADDAVLVHGVVAPDRRDALFSFAALAETDAALPPRLRLPGLDPALRYAIEIVDTGAAPRTIQDAPPPWLASGVELPGAVLAEVGVAMPLLAPGEAVLVGVRAAPAPDPTPTLRTTQGDP